MWSTGGVRPWGFEKFMEKHPGYVRWVLDQVRERGPLTAGDLPEPPGIPRRIPGAWFGTAPRAVLEAHFGRGELAVAERRPDFARVYDLAERVIPPEHYRLRAMAAWLSVDSIAVEPRADFARRLAAALGA